MRKWKVWSMGWAMFGRGVCASVRFCARGRRVGRRPEAEEGGGLKAGMDPPFGWPTDSVRPWGGAVVILNYIQTTDGFVEIKIIFFDGFTQRRGAAEKRGLGHRWGTDER